VTTATKLELAKQLLRDLLADGPRTKAEIKAERTHHGRVWRFTFGTGEPRWVAACAGCEWRVTTGAWSDALNEAKQHTTTNRKVRGHRRDPAGSPRAE